MTLHAAVLVSWSAAHLYVAALFGVVFLRNPGDPEYSSFSCASGGLSLVLLGAAYEVALDVPARATLGFTLIVVGGSLAVAGWAALVLQMLGRWSHTAQAAAGTWIVGSAILALSGATVDPGAEPLFAASYISPPGALWFPTAVLATTRISWLAIRVREPAVRAVGVGALVAGGAGLLDFLKLMVGSPVPFLFEHIVLAVTFFGGLGLSRRVLVAGDRLEARTTELRRNLEELTRVRAELVRNQQQATVGELAAALAHEIRNPLAVMRNGVSALRRRRGVDAPMLLDILDEESERLNRLVGDLRSYARPTELQKAAVDLHPLVEEASFAAEAQYGDKHRTVSLSLEGGPLRLWGDRQALRLALTNIVSNALQSMRNGGEVTVTTGTTTLDGRPAATIRVTDEGEGMDSLTRTKALRPFFTTRPMGTGLGLAIVDRILREHGGTLQIESRYGLGTSVTLTLRASE